jgi:hypothetical protein
MELAKEKSYGVQWLKDEQKQMNIINEISRICLW